MMSKTIEFYFDLGSPTAYLAHTQLPKLARDAGAALEYRPVLLGGIFQAAHNASPMTVPAKGQYMLRDLGRFAARYGVPLVMNPHFPVNTLTLMRGAIGVQQRMGERFGDYVEAMYRAMWVDGVNCNEPTAVAGVLDRSGFDAAAVLALAQDPAIKDALKAATDAAVKRGLFGVPTMFVGREMFFGQDRLDFVREAVQSK
jgi:2-hydroxychromene-2-carboxylate isomerase